MLQLAKILACFLLLTATTTTTTNAAKILGLFPYASESHFTAMRTVMLELARRQHKVTVYSSHSLSEKVENLTEIVIEPYPFWNEFQKYAGVRESGGLVALGKLPIDKTMRAVGAVGAVSLVYFLKQPQLQELLQLSTEEFDFDLIIVDLFYTEALLALGHEHKVPTIGIVNTNFEDYMNHVVDNMVPSGCTPIDFATYTKDVGHTDRKRQIQRCMRLRALFERNNFGLQQQIVNSFFKAKPVSIAQLQADLAVLLLNNHVPLLTPRTMLHNIIPAGGLHIRAARQLPWHIRRFLDEARSGVVYMNLGSEQLCYQLPDDKLKIIFNVFGKQKERLLWTCHDADIMERTPNLPGNIMIQHMVPQADILAHPHVRMFVMNGDLLSLQEGIVRHVPMLGLPIFRNQAKNMDIAVRLGIGLKVNYANLTEESFTQAIQVLTTDSEYPLTIRKVSSLYRDRPLGGLETTMYWVDYVLKYNGAQHIKTRGVGINSNHLHLIDLYLYYSLACTAAVVACAFVYFVVTRIFKLKID